jgi:PhnB protein
MSSLLNPYLSFNGDARAAMEFYEQVFGGTLALNTFGEFGDPSAPGADGIMHARLDSSGGFTLMGSDGPPGAELTAGNNFAVSLSGDDAAELRGYWDKLSAQGTVVMPLEKQMWGDEFGMCLDPYGIQWMVNITQPTG